MQGITFIGMAGAGKSAVGRILAEMVNWKFIDLDKYILEKQGITHHEYMKKFGEQALSNLENEYALGLNLDNTIFAPPGSMAYSKPAMHRLKQDTVIVYLRTTPEIIEKRMGDRLYKNGIIGLKEKGLAGLMDERIPLYEKYADYSFDSGDQSKQNMAEIVLRGLRREGVKI